MISFEVFLNYGFVRGLANKRGYQKINISIRATISDNAWNEVIRENINLVKGHILTLIPEAVRVGA